MKLHFPQQWYGAGERPLDTVELIEVRTLSSSPGEYFFAAVPSVYADPGYDPSSEARKRVYSENAYGVKLTPAPRVRAVTKQEWESATRIVTTGHIVSSNGPDLSSGVIEYRGKKFQKTGKYWQSGWLSPSGKWLAAFSYTGERTRDWFMDGGTVKSGDVFWDVYDTVTGEKVFAWRAKDVSVPTDLGGPVAWLEERYFLFPEDRDNQNFRVITLPEFIPETNPTTIALPSRMDANGARVSASINNPISMSLPLTPEQAAKLSSPQPPQLIEVRSSRQSSSRELLLAIREVTDKGRRHQAAKGREPAQDYEYYVLSTYYYALPVGGPKQGRFATKEEWESGSALQSIQRPAQHQFPKRGATSGGSLTSYMGQWTAVFSYTASGDNAGKMFIEIFDTWQGNKFSSTEFPYTGSATPLFNGALWIQGDYLLVPLKPSLDSFALWKLPGANPV